MPVVVGEHQVAIKSVLAVPEETAVAALVQTTLQMDLMVAMQQQIQVVAVEVADQLKIAVHLQQAVMVDLVL
jgi:hypothetical protein